jgi:hypothetical protein
MRTPAARIRRASSLQPVHLLLVAAMIAVAMLPTIIELGTQLIVGFRACASTLPVRETFGPML